MSLFPLRIKAGGACIMSALWLLLINRDNEDIDNSESNGNSTNVRYNNSSDEDTSTPWFVPVAILMLGLFLVGGLMAAMIA